MDYTDYNWLKAICKKVGILEFNEEELSNFSKAVSRKVKKGMYLEQARVDAFNYRSWKK